MWWVRSTMTWWVTNSVQDVTCSDGTTYSSNNSPLSLIVTLASFGCMSPEFKGICNCICVYEFIALSHLTPFYQMQRPFREKKHSAVGNPFSVEVRFHVSA